MAVKKGGAKPHKSLSKRTKMEWMKHYLAAEYQIARNEVHDATTKQERTKWEFACSVYRSVLSMAGYVDEHGDLPDWWEATDE